MLNNESKPCSVYVLLAVELVKKHIDTDPFKFKTAADLIDQVSTANRNLVAKAFKSLYDCGVKEYQIRQRLENSKIFLEKGMTQKVIASKCFYNSQTAYCRAFKREFKVTPSEWQARFVLEKQHARYKNVK